MDSSILLLAMIATTSPGQTILADEVQQQNSFYQQWCDKDFVWRFKDLPTSGSVPNHQIPYSGYIYQDKWGGTAEVLRKYDRAFNRGLNSAASWEKKDASANKQRPKGLLGFLGSPTTPDWYGHCNGWAAAAIRHPEPQKRVVAGGVAFSPADIKALLAEIYVYNDHQVLAGIDTKLNAGIFHAIICNWLGRASHAVAMDADPSKEKWNYPIFGYSSSFAYRSPYSVEVNTNIQFARDTEDREYDKSPTNNEVNLFHYLLRLNRRGEIIGGYFFRDSTKIDFLWVPLSPKASGQEGNENGNPYLDVAKVLAIYRKSVPQDVRDEWVCIDQPQRRAARPRMLPERDRAESIAVNPRTASPLLTRAAPTREPLRLQTFKIETPPPAEAVCTGGNEACLPAAPLPADTIAVILLKELIDARGLPRRNADELPMPRIRIATRPTRSALLGTAAD